MTKKIALLALCFSLILLISCTPSRPNDSSDVASVTDFVRSGTRGVDATFVQNLPPRQIFDTSELVTLVELRNEGAHDLGQEVFQQCFVHFGGFDPSIVKGINQIQSCGDLPGKSAFNPDGGLSVVEFESSNIVLPFDVDTYKPPLVATVCYEYTTIASPQVCIDSDFFSVTNDQRVCDIRDVSLGGGQGGPVGVTFVNVDMVGSKAIFQIQVSNLGSGRVVSPRASLTQCPSALRYNDFDEVQFNIQMSGGNLERCAPRDQIVRLSNGQGTFTCTFQVGNTPAYETPLRIELNYNYMDSIRRDVQIVRTPE